MIVLCLGRKSQGKTVLAYHLLSFMPKRVVLDPRDAFQTSDIVNTTGLGLYDDINDTEIDEVIVQSTDDLETVFETTCYELKDWIVDHRGESFGFLIDDSPLLLGQGPKIVLPNPFSWMLRSTKVDESRIILTSWRPSDIPIHVRSQADHWALFRTTELRDLDIIDERFGSKAVEIVKTLPPHVYLHCDDSGSELKMNVVNDPRSWYVDIAKLQGLSAEREKFVRA